MSHQPPPPGPAEEPTDQPAQRPYDARFGPTPPPPDEQTTPLPFGQPLQEQTTPLGEGRPLQQQPSYPRQDLLPQDVRPGRSRLPMLVALGLVLVLVAGGIAAWVLLRDDGESTRAEYCAAINDLAPDDDLITAVAGAGTATLDKAKRVVDLAPAAVAKEWTTLTDQVTAVQESQGRPDLQTLVAAYGALSTIVQDSNDNCGTAFTLPQLP